MGAMVASNQALMYVNYPTQVRKCDLLSKVFLCNVLEVLQKFAGTLQVIQQSSSQTSIDNKLIEVV